MTPEQNALLARLDGWNLDTAPWKISKYGCFVDPPDYDDERNLMPLAWKYGIAFQPMYLSGNDTVEVYACWSEKYKVSTPHKNPKIAIQQALLSIAREKYGE